jgi:hypothetical protein
MPKELLEKSLGMWPEANGRANCCRSISPGQLSQVGSVEVAIPNSNLLNWVEKLGSG